MPPHAGPRRLAGRAVGGDRDAGIAIGAGEQRGQSIACARGGEFQGVALQAGGMRHQGVGVATAVHDDEIAVAADAGLAQAGGQRREAFGVIQADEEAADHFTCRVAQRR